MDGEEGWMGGWIDGWMDKDGWIERMDVWCVVRGRTADKRNGWT